MSSALKSKRGMAPNGIVRVPNILCLPPKLFMNYEICLDFGLVQRDDASQLNLQSRFSNADSVYTNSRASMEEECAYHDSRASPCPRDEVRQASVRSKSNGEEIWLE